MDETQRHIKFIYTKSKDFRNIYVNGASGGVNDHCEVITNLYFEVRHTPDELTFELDNDGFLGKQIKSTSKTTTIDRILEASLILTEETARDLGEWLIERADLSKKRKAKLAKSEETCSKEDKEQSGDSFEVKV
jgi:hypothetical protein